MSKKANDKCRGCDMAVSKGVQYCPDCLEESEDDYYDFDYEDDAWFDEWYEA